MGRAGTERLGGRLAGLSWLDVAVPIVIVLFAYLGTRNGFLVGVLELAGLAVSIAIPLLTYAPVSRLTVGMGVSKVYAGAVTFFTIWLIVSNGYFILARRFYRRLPREVRKSRANRALGVVPGVARGLILVTLVLAVAATLPIPLLSDRAMDDSVIARPLLRSAAAVSTYATDIFGQAIQSAFGFLTIHPDSGELVKLPYTVRSPEIDPGAEAEMFHLVNRERVSRGLVPLRMDPAIRAVARKHSVDMFERGYFAHETPDGVDPFQRMKRGHVRFEEAGENLALARNVAIAHAGLMKSPGHRANILHPGFRRIGIGAAASRRYGIMFTQDFADAE